MAENNSVSVLHTMISEPAEHKCVVKVSTLDEASMMADSTVTVSAKLPAAVGYHTEAIKLDAGTLSQTTRCRKLRPSKLDY